MRHTSLTFDLRALLGAVGVVACITAIAVYVWPRTPLEVVDSAWEPLVLVARYGSIVWFVAGFIALVSGAVILPLVNLAFPPVSRALLGSSVCHALALILFVDSAGHNSLFHRWSTYCLLGMCISMLLGTLRALKSPAPDSTRWLLLGGWSVTIIYYIFLITIAVI
jgi:hypothetical protein